MDEPSAAGFPSTVSAAAAGASGKVTVPVASLRGILGKRDADYVPAASELESRFAALVRAAGLPEPVRQLDVDDEQHWIGRVESAYPRLGC